jgi:ABC-type transporter Mla subunit MlaD
MAMLKVILNGPAIFVIGCVVALIMITLSLIKLKRNLRVVKPKLDRANEMLAKEVGGLPKTRKRIAKLNKVAGTLENRSEQIESYGSQLSALVKRANKKDKTTEREVTISSQESPI